MQMSREHRESHGSRDPVHRQGLLCDSFRRAPSLTPGLAAAQGGHCHGPLYQGSPRSRQAHGKSGFLTPACLGHHVINHFLK